MNGVNDIDDYCYYRHPLNINYMPAVVNQLTGKIYLNKLVKLQIINTLILFSSIVMQAIAIATNDWFVLNVNEYVQTARGGLWYYCYLTTTGAPTQLNCYLYEKLPNFFVFANDRLFDSRTLLLCSCGFLFILILIEISSVCVLRISETRECNFCEKFLYQSSPRKFHLLSESRGETPMQTSTPKLKAYKKSINMNKRESNDIDDEFNVDIDFNQNQSHTRRKNRENNKPNGYFAFLATSLLTMVGSVMEFILKVAGFSLFDSYINRLLSFNRVFMAYRSWSYWLMCGSMVFMLAYWIFKVIATRYVVSLTKTLIKQDAALNAIGITNRNQSNIDNGYSLNNPKKSKMMNRPSVDDTIFSISNEPNNEMSMNSNIIMKQKYPYNHFKQQQISNMQKKSRRYTNGLISNPPRPSTRQSNLSYPSDMFSSNNEEYDESNHSTASQSIVNEMLSQNTIKTKQQMLTYPSFPYIYRF